MRSTAKISEANIHGSGWRKNYRLGDGCLIKHGFAFKGELMTTDGSEGLPVVVNIVNFQYTGGFRFETTKVQRYTGSFPDDYVLKPGSVLVVMTCQTPKGEILGVPGRIPSDGRTYLHNQRLGLACVTDSNALDLGYLYYVFLSPRFNAHLFGTATGAKILHTAPSRIENYRFDCPPVAMQRKIAAVLWAYDDLIENNSRRIRILEAMAQAIYRAWFVHFRFPGHKKVKFVPSPLGPIPVGWSVAKLATMADVNALSIQRGEEPGEIAYVDIASVSPGSIDEAKRMKFEDAPGRARRIVRHGDIIWSMVRPNRRSFALVLDPEPNLIASTGFAVVSATRIPSSYLYRALTTDEFIGYLANRATGAAYPAVKAEDFENAEILRPDDTTLERFDGLVVPMLEMRDSLAKKNRNLRLTRDLLLPKLISGELDVSNLDIRVGGAV